MKKKVYAYLHTHWDREWYRNKEEFNLRFLEVFDIVLDELKNNRAPFFYLDGQVVALLDYLKYRPEKKEEIINLIKNKKLAIGPYFVSADSYLVDFPSMLKNLDLGLRISKEFNQKEFIGYLSDIFGVSNSIFEALRLKNIDTALIWRGVNPKKNKNKCDFIKNNIRTTWLSKGYFNDFFHFKEPNIDGIKKYLDDISKYSSEYLLLPIGSDHLGILKNAKEVIKNVNKKLDNYEIVLSSPFEYFKNVNYEIVTKEKEFLDNSDTYILQGVYSSRIDQKIQNVLLQNKLSRIIEPLNYYLKLNYSSNIDFAYQTLIKNHAHDGIYGCSVDDVHIATKARFDKCQNITNALIDRIIGDFKKKNKIEGKSKNKLGLFNLSNNNNIKTLKLELPYVLENSQVLSKRNDFPKDLYYDIYQIPVTEDITPIYTQLVEVSKNNKFEFNVVDIIEPKKLVKITEKSIENENIKLQIKNNKIYVLDKKSEKKYTLFLTDISDSGDSYNFAPVGNYEKIQFLNSKIMYDGKIESCLRLNYKDIKLDVTLNNHSEFLKFRTIINNKHKNHKLQLVLNSSENIVKTQSQDACGIIERKIDCNYKMQDFMPAKRPVELKTNAFPMQSFVLANEIGVLTKGLHEYEIYKNELRICLLRCFSTISNPKNSARSIPAGPNLETPNAQMLGENVCEFALLFNKKNKIYSLLDEFFENYIVIDGELKEENNFKLDLIQDNEFVLGVNNSKKISYNLKENKISLI